jgi:hypothetical protein
MIFQDEFSAALIGSIIGSIIATLGSILAWVIIEILKNSRDKRELKKDIRSLYKEFAKEKLEPYMAINIKELIRDISLENLLKILKFDSKLDEDTLIFTSEIFNIELTYEMGQNIVVITEWENTNKRFDYNEPSIHPEVRVKFLEDFRRKCETSEIKIKIKKKRTNPG